MKLKSLALATAIVAAGPVLGGLVADRKSVV